MKKYKIEKRFLDLAHLLLEIMIESEEYADVPKSFKMPKNVINRTAHTLQDHYKAGKYTETNGGLYYSGMTEDFGGYFDREMAKFVKDRYK